MQSIELSSKKAHFLKSQVECHPYIHLFAHVLVFCINWLMFISDSGLFTFSTSGQQPGFEREFIIYTTKCKVVSSVSNS